MAGCGWEETPLPKSREVYPRSLIHRTESGGAEQNLSKNCYRPLFPACLVVSCPPQSHTSDGICGGLSSRISCSPLQQFVLRARESDGWRVSDASNLQMGAGTQVGGPGGGQHTVESSLS